MPKRGTLLHRVYKLAMLQYSLLYEQDKLRKTKLRREIRKMEVEIVEKKDKETE